MTSRTACHYLFPSDLVLLFQLEPLIGGEVSVLPPHIEHFRLRPDEFLGLAMTRQTPFHLQRVLLINRRHVVDLAVARRAPDSLRYVNTVIEISKLGQVVDAFPFDRFVVAEARTDGFKVRTIAPDLAVTVHTGLRRWHARGRGRLDRRVTVTTVDAIVTHVVLMAELHRLGPFKIASRQIRRAGDLRINIERRPCKNDAEYHAYSRDVICTLVKKLRHYQVSRIRRFAIQLNLHGYRVVRDPTGIREIELLIEKASVKLKTILLNLLDSANMFTKKVN